LIRPFGSAKIGVSVIEGASKFNEGDLAMRRREFLTSTLAVGATAATPAGASTPAKQYSVTMLPPDRGLPGSEVTLEPPIDTTVQFIDQADIQQRYRDVLLHFRHDNPAVDLTDPNSFLIVAKPRQEPGAVEVADCMCQCGHAGSGGSGPCGGGGGGSKAKAAAKT
jgi:hypothetical protein